MARSQSLVEDTDVAVKLSKTAAAIRILAVGRQRATAAARPSAGPPEDRPQMGGRLLVCFDLEGVTRTRLLRGAGVDGPALATLTAPVPAEVLGGLADVVGHHMDD